MLRIGAHMSIAGGVDRAIPIGKRAGCEVLQIFTKSSNQWAARPLRDEEVAAFSSNQKDLALPVVAAHDSYLINLASPDETLWRKSVAAFREEMNRCETLGIPYLIFHPGSHVGSGEGAAFARIASALDELHAGTRGFRVRVLLENAAGQGTNVGSRFEHLAEIISLAKDPERLGVCFDTCHAHAAGYELRTRAGFERTFGEFDRIVGLSRLRAFHLNDCKQDLGCRLDRHWHIGHGFLGLEPFRLLLNDPRVEGIPGFLETPKGEECEEDVVNLGVLRSLLGDRKEKPIPIAMTPLAGGGAE
jgi:deoxyribonuclease-4